MKTYRLIPTEKADEIPTELYERLVFEGSLDIRAADEDEAFPMPWDADLTVETGKPLEPHVLVLNGGAGPSGFGSCQTKIPMKHAASVLTITWSGDTDLTAAEIDQLNKAGWNVDDRVQE